MNCELCGSKIQNSEFGDVDGAIVCPRCLGHVPGVEMDSTVAEFYKRNRDEFIYDEANALSKQSFVDACSRRDSKKL